MPRVPNKIIINCLRFLADGLAMLLAFWSGNVLSREIIKVGGGIQNNSLLTEDANQFLTEQEAICADLDNAMADCLDRQRDLNERRRKWFDSKLKP